MAKRQVIGLTEAWRVWLGESPAVRVATESEAKALILANGKEYGIANNQGRCDVASPVAELLWNTPLPDGEVFHKTVISPVNMVLHNGHLRKIIASLSPSRLATISRGWYALEPALPAWWPRQYLAAVQDSAVLVLRGGKSLRNQMDAKWPVSKSWQYCKETQADIR